MKITKYFRGFIFLLFLLFANAVFSQNVGISTSSSFTPDASAALDVSYTNKGLLIPRVALTANNTAGPIASPATSLLVYNTATAGSSPNNVIPGYYYWNGSVWVMLSTSTPSSGYWSTTGNTGTGYPINYLGANDNFGLHFKTNAIHRMWLDSLGSVAIGTSPTFSSNAANREKFLVDAGITSSFNVISGKGNVNNYLQLNIQNLNAGTGASSDVVATADNGSESINYVDMGTNSSANTANIFGGANDSYLYSAGGSSSSTAGGNLYIGTNTSGKNLGFLTGGSTIGIAANGSTAAAANNERLHIDGTTGYIGINNPSPAQQLDVAGNVRFSGALMPNNNAGTAGNFLVSSGAGNAPVWFNANSYAWLTTGNAGTSSSTNFLGTTDNRPFRIRTNNIQRMLLDSLGNVAIGSSPTFSTNMEKLLVDAGTTTSYNVISGKGNLNSYLQLNIQNNNAGTTASSDVVASADNASETANYVDMGINSSGNTSTGVLGGANLAYLLATGSDFAIGNGAASKNLLFFTSGTASTATNAERMRIDPSGNVGIGTTSPATRLHVFGANPLTLSGVVTGSNTTADGLLTITSGLVRKLPLSTFASAANAWSTTGNTGTTAGTNFIGTTDATNFIIKTNNAEVTRITSDGNVAIGSSTTAFNTSNPEQLLVDAGTTSSTNVISGKGSINSFLQLNIQNISTGTSASTDVVATADNGTDAANYVDMGINGSNNKNTFYYGVANDAYLYNAGGSLGGNFYIGTSTSGKSLAFLTGGTAASNERMRINGSGYVGIGTTNPRYPLEIASKVAYTTGTYNAYNNNTDGWSTNDAFSYYANGSTSSTANASTGGSGTYYSIVTAGRIAAKEFNAYSDKREKIVIGQSNSKSDLALLNKLKITDYTWIDKIGKSPIPEKKLIAQELRAVYPQAVKLIPGFIPNVYQKPIAVRFDSTKKTMLLNFSKPHNSVKGDLLRIYVFDKLHEVTVKDILSSSALTVDFTDISDLNTYAKDIFVFGKKVDDYHTVDYDAVSMLNVSATQELYRQLEQQKEESKKVIDDLKKQLEDQNQRIKRLEEKFK